MVLLVPQTLCVRRRPPQKHALCPIYRSSSAAAHRPQVVLERLELFVEPTLKRVFQWGVLSIQAFELQN